MPILLSVLYALHVLCGIMWFGGALYSLLILGPAFAGISGNTMAEVGPRIGARAEKVMPAAATATLFLGIATAYATGRFVHLSDMIADSYGITLLVALAIAVGTWFWGNNVVKGRIHAMQVAVPSDKPAAFKRVMQAVGIEMAGFLSILFCMVLLRFGY